jgi:uncharacterized Zn finger protein
MAKMSKTWWGEKFIDGLMQFLDEGRLKRGRSYRGDNRILSFDITDNCISAEVRGNVNHYFGVYKEPRYKVSIEISSFPKGRWTKIIRHLASNAAWISQLLMNEMPDNIEDVFSRSGLHFLPDMKKDFKTECSCPDYANPCKHIAGVYYRVASILDTDPFLLFQLRGLSKKELHNELSKTSLGQALLAGLTGDKVKEIIPRERYFTHPAQEPIPGQMSFKEFWTGKKRLPEKIQPKQRETQVSALFIKKQGDYPPFWGRDNSFIAAMEDIDEQVKKKNRKSL